MCLPVPNTTLQVTNFYSTIFWVVSVQKEAIRQITATLVIMITPSLTYYRLASCAVNLKDWTDGNILPAELQFNAQ